MLVTPASCERGEDGDTIRFAVDVPGYFPETRFANRLVNWFVTLRCQSRTRWRFAIPAFRAPGVPELPPPNLAGPLSTPDQKLATRAGQLGLCILGLTWVDWL